MDWRALEARIDSAVVGAFAEPLEFVPMCGTPNGRGVPDPDRDAITIRGVLHAPDQTMPVSPGPDYRAKANSQRVSLVINGADHPGLEVRQGDVFTATERPGWRPMRVGKVSDRFASIIIVDLWD